MKQLNKVTEIGRVVKTFDRFKELYNSSTTAPKLTITYFGMDASSVPSLTITWTSGSMQYTYCASGFISIMSCKKYLIENQIISQEDVNQIFGEPNEEIPY